LLESLLTQATTTNDLKGRSLSSNHKQTTNSKIDFIMSKNIYQKQIILMRTDKCMYASHNMPLLTPRNEVFLAGYS